MSSRGANRLIAGVLGLGAGLRIAGLFAFPLWYDEANTLWFASLPFSKMIAATAGDIHPPGLYLVAAVTIRILGAGPWALRLPSCAAGIAGMIATVLIGRRLGLGAVAQVGAAVAMALSPFQLFFSDDGRMYAMLQAAYLFGLLAVLGHGRHRKLWILLSMVGLLWLHAYGFIYSAVLGVLLLGRVWQAERHSIRAWLGAAGVGLGALGSYAPWGLVLAQQTSTFSGGHWLYWFRPVTLGNWVYPFYTNIFMFALPAGLQTAGAIALFTFYVFAIARAIRKRHRPALLLAGLLGGPAIAAGAVSLVWQPVYLFRALIGLSPAACLLLGWAFGDLPAWGRRWAGVVMVPLLVVATANYWPSTYQQKAGSLPLVRALLAEWQPGDIVYHTDIGSLVECWPYMAGRPFALQPGLPAGLSGLTPATRAAMGIVEQPLAALEWRRAWVVVEIGPVTPAGNAAGLLADYPGAVLKYKTAGEYGEAELWLISKAS